MSTIASANVQSIQSQAAPLGGRRRLNGPIGPNGIWLQCLKCAIALCIVGWIVADTLGDFFSLGFNDAESSHVLLAPLVIAWLAWVRRARVAQCSGRGRWTGAVMIAVGWVMWARGYHYQIQSFWHFGALLLLGGTLLVLLGADALWKFLPAWGALIFLLPMPGRVHLQIAVPLEHVTAILTQSLGEALGMNVARSGNQLNVNGVDVCIAEACNGLRMVFSLFMACYVYAFIRPFQPWVRIVVLAASPIVAITCNVIRLVPTVWMFGHASPATAERFHDLAGWAMLGVAFALLTGFTKLISWLGLPLYTEANPNAIADLALPAVAR